MTIKTKILSTMRMISLGVALALATCTAAAPVYALNSEVPISRDTMRLPMSSEEEINNYFNWKDPTWSLGRFVMSGVLLDFGDGLTNFSPYGNGPDNIRVLISTGARDAYNCIGVYIEVESMVPGSVIPSLGYDHKELLVRYCDTKKVEL